MATTGLAACFCCCLDKFYGKTAVPIHLRVVCGSPRAAGRERRRGSRNRVARKAEPSAKRPVTRRAVLRAQNARAAQAREHLEPCLLMSNTMLSHLSVNSIF